MRGLWATCTAAFGAVLYLRKRLKRLHAASFAPPDRARIVFDCRGTDDAGSISFMPQNQPRQIEVAWAAVAWTQFLIAITVIDKNDMKLIGAFFKMLFPETPEAFVFDSRPFGSVALLLNVIALALFSLPLSALHTWEDIDFDIERYMSRARYVAMFAHLFWGFSFLALLCYLNPTFAWVAFLFVAIGGFCIGPISRYKRKR